MNVKTAVLEYQPPQDQWPHMRGDERYNRYVKCLREFARRGASDELLDSIDAVYLRAAEYRDAGRICWGVVLGLEGILDSGIDVNSIVP